MNKLLEFLTPWHDKKKADMKQKHTNDAVDSAKKTVDKTREIVEQYQLVGYIVAQERKGKSLSTH